MSNNFDFGTTYGTMNPMSSTKLTVYGTQGTIPPNPPRFPNAYLTAPNYDLFNNIVQHNSPKLTIYRTIPTTVYPFDYIGTPAISNYGLLGQIAPVNAPKLNVYTTDQILMYSFEYDGTISSSSLITTPTTLSLSSLQNFDSGYLPIIKGNNNQLTILNSIATINGKKITVSIKITYIDDGVNDFGLTFNNANKLTFYNSTLVKNLTISTLSNIPLSRTGSQFAGLTKVSNLFETNAVIPTILPSSKLNLCFSECSEFNSDISGWNTTNVINMPNMFNGCVKFNSDISLWKTDNVTNMANMFTDCANFNQNISGWNTTNVTSMVNMFNGCAAFKNNNNNSLTTFVKSRVTNLGGMFSGCSEFNSDISGWITSAVTNMSNMFNGCAKFNNGQASGLSGNTLNWITSAVTNMSNMFTGCAVFNQNISDWNTNIVTTMANMFNGCAAFKNNNNNSLTTFVKVSVRNLEGMFNGCSEFNSDISGWITSAVTNMSNMFNGCAKFNQNINTKNINTNIYWNTFKVTSMAYMFYGCQAFNQPLNNWFNAYYSQNSEFNPDINNTSYMFYNCLVFNQDISNWFAGRITNISYMFNGAKSFNNNNTVMTKTIEYNGGIYTIKTWALISTTLSTNYSNWHGSGLNATDTNYCPLTSANAPTLLRISPYWN
jgi:surface protein